MISITVIDQDRPLRSDAQRNRRRILDAARELFAQRGLEVTLNEIAHHAGVGVGTVYRRFPDRSQLIETLFEERIGALVALAQDAVADPDPWRGLTGFFERALSLQANDCALMDLALGRPGGLSRIAEVRARLLPLASELVARAHAGGRLAPDITPEDLPIVQLMLSAVIDAARDVDPELWRRYLALILRGLAADADPDAGRPPLPGPALAPGQVDAVMSRVAPPRRTAGQEPSAPASLDSMSE